MHGMRMQLTPLYCSTTTKRTTISALHFPLPDRAATLKNMQNNQTKMDLGLNQYDSSDSDAEVSATKSVNEKVHFRVDSINLVENHETNIQACKRTILSSDSPRKKLRSGKDALISPLLSPYQQEFATGTPLPSNTFNGTKDMSMPPPPNFDDDSDRSASRPPQLLLPSATWPCKSFLGHRGGRSRSSELFTKRESKREVANKYFLPPQLKLKRPNVSTEDLASYGCVETRSESKLTRHADEAL